MRVQPSPRLLLAPSAQPALPALRFEGLLRNALSKALAKPATTQPPQTDTFEPKSAPKKRERRPHWIADGCENTLPSYA
jgi:hypothetical protein